MRTVPIRRSGYPHGRCADKGWPFLSARKVTDFCPLAVNKLYFACIMIYFDKMYFCSKALIIFTCRVGAGDPHRKSGS